jgi:hypothetical protein
MRIRNNKASLISNFDLWFKLLNINHARFVLRPDKLNPSRIANQLLNFLPTIKNPDSKTILDEIARTIKRKVDSISGRAVIM